MDFGKADSLSNGQTPTPRKGLLQPGMTLRRLQERRSYDQRTSGRQIPSPEWGLFLGRGHLVQVSADALAASGAFHRVRRLGDDLAFLQPAAKLPLLVHLFLFRRSGGSWAQEAYLKASNTDAQDRFGRSVSLYGEIMAAGAILEDGGAAGLDGDQSDNGSDSSGAVYIFHRSEGSWKQRTYLKASNPDGPHADQFLGDRFGGAAALWEDSLAVAAPFEDSKATGMNSGQNDNSAAESGAVYIFH